MTPSKDVTRLIEIMSALRDKETGCPWDIEQDFDTIAPHTLEETYEVLEAIENKDFLELEEELGDLLLQVAYHAQMASEDGHFDFGDVVYAITKKMIRRHPHVFGDKSQRSKSEIKGNWSRIKAEEKAEKIQKRAELGLAPLSEKTGILSDIPAAMPALIRAQKIQDKVAKVGFDWDDPNLVLDKIEEEIGELREALAQGKSEEIRGEMGDLMFTLVNLARHVDVDSEAALRGCNSKFESRFSHIEKRLAEDGSSPSKASLERMEELWREAKRIEKS